MLCPYHEIILVVKDRKICLDDALGWKPAGRHPDAIASHKQETDDVSGWKPVGRHPDINALHE